MSATLGYHVVKSGYGLWLPGDERGHWSEAWDDELGFIGPHKLHLGDPVRLRMSEERMKHPPVRWTEPMIAAMASAIGRCAAQSPWKVSAAAIEPTHMHLLITYSGLEIDRTAKWLAQEMTKAVHRETTHTGPVFAKGRWRGFVFDDEHWNNTIQYIEAHNTRRGFDPQPFAFIERIVAE